MIEDKSVSRFFPPDHFLGQEFVLPEQLWEVLFSQGIGVCAPTDPYALTDVDLP